MLRVSIFLFLLVAGHAVGQNASGGNVTPEQVAESYITALKEDRMDDVAGYMHPEALESFRNLLLPLLDAATKRKKEKEVLMIFKGVSSVKALKKLDSKKFFEAFLVGVMRVKPDLRATLAKADVRVLGHVMQGDTAHVVYRITMDPEGTPINNVTLVSLRASASGWGVLLSAQMEGIATRLKYMLQEDED
jgi:hypothetical protein